MALIGTALLAILVLFVAVWVAIFGCAGAAIARHHDRTRIRGFVVGALAGPLGCLWLLWNPR